MKVQMKNHDFVLPPKTHPLKETPGSCQTITEQNPICTSEAAASGMNVHVPSEYLITVLFLSPYIK